MTALLIETSTERGLVTMLQEDKLLYCIPLPFGYQNSEFLIPSIEQLLKESGIPLSQLSLILTGIGPGSYTGIRIGAVVAKSFAYVLKLPLVGICSLEGYVPDRDGPFAAIIDAKIGGVYLLKGKKEKNRITYTSQPEICEIEKLAEKLNGIDLLVTPCQSRIAPLIEKQITEKKWQWQERDPSPIHLAQSGFAKFQEGKASHDTHLELMYLRKTQAEIEIGLSGQKWTKVD